MAPSAPDSLSFFQLPIPMAESVSPQSPLVETIDNTYSSDEQEYASATKTTSKIWASSFLRQLDFQQGMQ